MKCWGLLLAIAMAAVGVHAIDALPLEKDVPESIVSLGQIEKIIHETQEQFWKLVPPASDDPFYLHSERMVRAVDWDSKEWPDSFLAQMYAEMGTAGLSGSMYPFYRLTVVETRAGELVYYNSYDREIWRTVAPIDYNEYLFAFQSWNVDSVEDLTSQQKIYGRSSNVGLEILLLPKVFIDSYEEDVALEIQATEITAPMTMMLLPPPVVTNLMLSIGTESNEVEVGVYFPNNYTNPVDVFVSTSLIEWDWSLFTNVSSANISEFTWIDEAATNFPTHFWVAARSDVDTDGDGLADGREIYVHGSKPDDQDSDDDGLDDDVEVENSPPTDPSNSDRQAPAISIASPVNNIVVVP